MAIGMTIIKTVVMTVVMTVIMTKAMEDLKTTARQCFTRTGHTAARGKHCALRRILEL